MEVWDRQQAMHATVDTQHIARGMPVAGTGSTLVDSLPKDTRRVVAPAVRRGWEPSMDSRGHVKFTKDGRCFSCASTPSDQRGIRNLRATMRRLGAIE